MFGRPGSWLKKLKDPKSRVKKVESNTNVGGGSFRVTRSGDMAPPTRQTSRPRNVLALFELLCANPNNGLAGN